MEQRKMAFRAWDEENRLMWHAFFMNSSDGVVIDWDPRNRRHQAKDFPLMQFTGLKDKNGKEIYEGDIVKQGGHDDAEVFFRNGSFATYLSADKSDGWLEMSQNSFEFEVIGNVYENPDLLPTPSQV